MEKELEPIVDAGALVSGKFSGSGLEGFGALCLGGISYGLPLREDWDAAAAKGDEEACKAFFHRPLGSARLVGPKGGATRASDTVG